MVVAVGVGVGVVGVGVGVGGAHFCRMNESMNLGLSQLKVRCNNPPMEFYTIQ